MYFFIDKSLNVVGWIPTYCRGSSVCHIRSRTWTKAHSCIFGLWETRWV